MRIKDKEYLLEATGKFGREGELYRIAGYSISKLAKVYYSDKRTAFVQRKVTAIINRFRQIDLGGVENYIAHPEVPIYDAKNNAFCGFLMKYFHTHSDLFDSRYDLNLSSYRDESLDDTKAISTITTLFAYLEVLHNAGFILGDINPDNILFDKETLMPVIVDFDSAQMGTYYSNTKRQEYIDPTVRIDGYGRNKYFIYTTDSDIFSMALVCYQFIVGVHPYFFQTSIPTDTEYKKTNALSFIEYFEGNLSKINQYKFDIFENPLYEAIKIRLNYLLNKHPHIYNFFRSIFLEGNRQYLTIYGSQKYNVSSRTLIDDRENELLEIIPQSKGDPDELELFMKQFKLRLF